MKLNLRRVVASASLLAIAGGVLAATASVASAATTPPWEPDPNSLGSLTLYSCTTPGTPSTCSVVTGGSNLSHLFDYAEASTTDPSSPAGNKAVIYFAQPEPNTATGAFPQAQASSAVLFPNSTAPYTGANPLATLASTDGNLANFIASQTAPTATGYVNVYQIRLYTTSASQTGTLGAGTYWDVDISVNPSAGTWTQIYPNVVTKTTTSLSATPSPANSGQTVTLTATESPATAGSVEFENGGTEIGTGSVAVNSGGVATLTTSFAAAGTENLSAVFTPTDTTDFGGSTGTATLTVNPPATPTAITLTVNQSGTTGTDVNMSSTVTASGTPVTAGTVSWYDNGSTTPLNSTAVTPNASGVATFDIPGGLAAGSHSIVAVFTPTSVAQYESSSSAPQSFVLQAPQTGACAQTGSNCTDTQNIEATIPVGTLVLSTPYTAASPLNLGTLALNSGLTEYSANAPFNGITIVDTRAGDLPWTLTALASNLSDGGHNAGSLICSQNVGLTGVTSTPGSGFAGTVTTDSNPAASPPIAPVAGACTGTGGVGGTTAATVASASAGLGTDVLNGTLTLNAPTSTEPGLFTGTITFTVG